YDAALHRGHDLAAGKGDDRNAELPVGLGTDAVDPVLHALQIFEIGDRLREPAESLRIVGRNWEGDEIQLEHVAIELFEELHPAAVVVPAEIVDAVHSEDRTVRERDAGQALAENVAERRHPDVENAARRGIEHLEGRDDGAAGQNLDLEAAARHLLGGFAPELEDQVEIGRGWMGRLPLE